jgi:hypothetical protein
VWENLDEPTIMVTGAVTSGAGSISSFTLNGEEVSLDEDGRFAVEFTPSVGGNTLEFDATDSMGSDRKRVQSFHWAISYLDPKVDDVELPCSGELADNMCFQAFLEEEMQWSPSEQRCQEWGGHLAGIHSEAQNIAANAQLLSVCGEQPAWIGINDNLKEGYYVWSDGWKFDVEGPPQTVPATITGVSGEPLDGTMADALGLNDGGAVLQDGNVGGGLGDGVYLSSAPGSYPSDYFASGVPIVLEYDFGGTVLVSSFRVGLYDYQNGVGHPNSATSFSISLGSEPGASDVVDGIILDVDLEGASGQILQLGGSYEAAYARVEILDNGYNEASGGTDPAGGHRVGLSEAAFDTTLSYENWAPGEPNDWGDDEDVNAMYGNGQWNDFNGDTTLECFICAKVGASLEYTGHSDPGMGIFLSPDLIDDGDHSLPANDLGTIFEMVFAEFDLAKAIPNPAASGVEAAGGSYDVYITGLTNDQPTVGLTLMEGGWILNAEINNVAAEIEAPKLSGGFLLPNTITGTLYISTISVTANVFFSVTDDHQLDAIVEDIAVSIDGVSVEIDGWLGWIIEAALEGTLDSLVGDIENTLGDELGDVLTPMLIDALGSLAFGFDFELPSINPEGAPVAMDIATDFSSVDFTSTGDLLALRSIAMAKEPVVSYDSLGAPARDGCGVIEQTLEVLKEAPMEIVMNDDTVNMVFYSAWRGGFLDFDIPPSLLAGVNLEALSVKDLQANVSGLLAPAVSDCANGELTLHVGDLKLTASMEFIGKPLDVEAYASFDAKFEIGASEGEISFGVNDVTNVKLELTALQDDQISVEPLLRMLIQDNLVPSLTDGLSGDSLGGLPLPDVEIDASGTPVAIGIKPIWVKRENGNNIVGAELEFLDGSETSTPAEE